MGGVVLHSPIWKSVVFFLNLLSGFDSSPLPLYLRPLLLFFPSRWCSRTISSLGIDPLFLRLRRL